MTVLFYTGQIENDMPAKMIERKGIAVQVCGIR